MSVKELKVRNTVADVDVNTVSPDSKWLELRWP